MTIGGRSKPATPSVRLARKRPKPSASGGGPLPAQVTGYTATITGYGSGVQVLGDGTAIVGVIPGNLHMIALALARNDSTTPNVPTISHANVTSFTLVATATRNADPLRLRLCFFEPDNSLASPSLGAGDFITVDPGAAGTHLYNGLVIEVDHARGATPCCYAAESGTDHDFGTGFVAPFASPQTTVNDCVIAWVSAIQVSGSPTSPQPGAAETFYAPGFTGPIIAYVGSIIAASTISFAAQGVFFDHLTYDVVDLGSAPDASDPPHVWLKATVRGGG